MDKHIMVIILLLLFALANDTDDLYRTPLATALIAVVAYKISGNPIYTIYVTLGAVIVLQLFVGSIYGSIERFENEAKSNALLNAVEDDLKKSEKEISSADKALNKVVDNEEDEPSTEAEMKGGPSSDGPSSDAMERYTDKINTRELAKAQKETFQIINTVKQLRDVMESLAPALKESKNVLKMYETLKL